MNENHDNKGRFATGSSSGSLHRDFYGNIVGRRDRTVRELNKKIARAEAYAKHAREIKDREAARGEAARARGGVMSTRGIATYTAAHRTEKRAVKLISEYTKEFSR